MTTNTKRTRVYLAGPYTHNDPVVVKKRVDRLRVATAMLMKQKSLLVICPVVMCHQLCVFGIPGDFEFWSDYDKWLLDSCDELYVLTLRGFKKSIGVISEVQHAIMTRKPVVYVDYREEWERELVAKQLD